MSKTKHICGKSPKSRDIGDTYRMVGNKGRSIQRHSKSPNILKTLLQNLKSSPQHEPQASRMDASCKQPVGPNQYNPANYQPCLQDMVAAIEGFTAGSVLDFRTVIPDTVWGRMEGGKSIDQEEIQLKGLSWAWGSDIKERYIIKI